MGNNKRSRDQVRLAVYHAALELTAAEKQLLTVFDLMDVVDRHQLGELLDHELGDELRRLARSVEPPVVESIDIDELPTVPGFLRPWAE